ncbi:uncharacterized protein LOC111886422 [Lactuca sativa]|uniref:Uncharacterized protein n=1 Tax=Lactuca sativa TaxID=4236 RepID=A0A9R1UIU7_LACSA|nr:uncharacterized protein LOC111886422 [Lactuca sativa]KAJ0187934.1 hypothetical protein LSAT_V11C900457860 [Lactuca sativa]
MRDFPSCFGENGVQIADASSSSSASITTASGKIGQNLVTCVYQCRLRNFSCFIITVTWTKNLMGQGLSVQIDDSTNQCLCKVEIKPWLFSKRRGCKNIEVSSKLIDIYWDLASAKFGFSPEPLEGFYFAIVVNQDLILVLGDMEKEVQKKVDVSSFAPNVVFLSKKEHIFGKKVYATKARLCGKGKMHDVSIECDALGTNDPYLLIRVDGKTMMQVKHLRWKFRGNYTILVDGLPVEVYWDVHNWLFGKLMGEAIFLFQTCLSAEKLWASPSMLDSSWSGSCSRDPHSQGLGFSLVLCAWKNE